VKKNFFFLFLTYFFLIFFFEFSARVIVYITTKDLNILSYGFNKNISFQIRDLSNLNFEIIKHETQTNKQVINLKENTNKSLLWAFGGSTSDIACKAENNTSWPYEIEKIDDKYQVNNFSRSGSNSDFALNSLLSNLYSNKNPKPEIILWANYVNETDVLTFGFKNNRFLENDVQIDKFKNTLFYYLKSVSISFENNSIFYSLFKRIVLALISYSNIPFKYDLRTFPEKEIELAAKNYFLNTSKAIEVSKKLDIKFYIILLFDKTDLNILKKSAHHKLKDKIFIREIKKLKLKYPDIKIINLKSLKNKKIDNKENIFCDEIHFTSYGNQVVSNLVLYSLLSGN